MKAVPLPFEEFRGKGVLDFGSAASDSFLTQQKWNHNHNINNILQEHCYVGTEPNSVLNVRRNPSPPTSSSTLSSSHGGGGSCSGATGSTDSSTGAAAAAKVSGDNPPPHTAIDAAPPAALERCGMGMEDWESVLSESPGQDQSILRMIMGDIEDPSVGLSKLLQSGSGSHQDVVDFNGGGGGGFGVMDQSSVLDHISGANFASSIDPSGPPSGNCSDFPFNTIHNASFNSNIARVGSSVNPNPIFPPSPTSLPPGMFQPQHHQQAMDSLDEKPQILNPQFILNQNQTQFMQNPAFVMPLSYEHQLLAQPPAKRPNCGPVRPNYQVLKAPFLDPGQELYLRRGQQPPPLQLLPHHLQQRQASSPAMPPKQKIASPGEELVTHQLQQSVMDKLFKATEMIETGNPELAQGILARLNHQLSPIGKPFQRAAFYMKEALQSLLLHLNNASSNNSLTFSPSGLVLKIGACKSFSEISPVLQFSNFTCNQALLEAVEGFDRIHIMDFDIGFGGQWASFMQELALRNGGSPSLKITAFVSPSNHDEIELSFTQEILKQYSSDLSIPFEIEILSLESLNTASWPQPLRDCEAIAVNLPIASFSHCPSYLSLVLRFLKQLVPKIVVTVDRPCDRTDAPFAQHLIYALQSYSVLLESLDAVSVNLDVLQMIEKYLVQPAMEKLVLGRHRLHERTPQWKTLLLTSGFTPLPLSNFTESQAECLVQRNPGRGFHVEKKQSSLVLCWQRKELISVSTWGC